MEEYVSYGILPIYRGDNNEKQYLVLQSLGGYWGFPKGTPEYSESPKETAIREAHEEAGLNISDEELGKEVEYSYAVPLYNRKVTKKVILYPAYVSTRVVDIQRDEIRDYRWVSADTAVKLINLPFIGDVMASVENSY